MPVKKTAPTKSAPPQKPAAKKAGGASKSWFQSGFAAADQEAERQKIAREDIATGVRRFWMPKNSERRILYIDGIPINIREHQFYSPGAGGPPKFKTCLRGPYERCPYDESNKASFTGCLTIYDFNEWEDKKGNTHVSGVELYAAKASSIQILRVIAEKKGRTEAKGGLAGFVFDVYRSGAEKGPSVGDNYQLVEIIDFSPKSLKKYGLDKKPAVLDYETILAPDTPEEAKKWMQTMGEGGGREDEMEY